MAMMSEWLSFYSLWLYLWYSGLSPDHFVSCYSLSALLTRAQCHCGIFFISFFISFSYFFISIIDANRDNDTDGWVGHKGSMSMSTYLW